MDPRLREYYERELQHLHEMGAEFARQYPKIAARLGMRGIEVADPYVERLLEGFGFLAARVQLKLDAEFPRFTQRLLEMVYPHYVAPTPALLVAQINPELTETNLATGFTVPRGSLMHGMVGREDDTACDFRTAHDVTLWPIQVAEAKYFSFAPDLPLGALRGGQPVKGGVRLKLRATAGLKFNQIGIDRLRLYLSGADEVARKLYELAFASPMGAMLVPTSRPAPWFEIVSANQLQPAGFADDEALLPVTWRSFQGYRLLQEYFSFPQRFLFLDVAGLKGRIQRCTGDELELVLLFGRGDPMLERWWMPRTLAVLHAGCQSLPEARRPHTGERRDPRVSRRSRPHTAHGLRSVRSEQCDRLRCGRRQRAKLSAVLCARARYE
jgi:type VI secretion system protein ImpG